ncbi:hypothetical protein AMECASPLE_028711 [Ameca splendens]|uniref:MADF domain-containing protein n=1 Tax=Ameca splendens TaxID=208324 RepID=A0ABV1A249_9TELE
MEDQIIVAECGKPELYDSTNYFYRDKYRKDLAWRRVNEETGVADRLHRPKKIEGKPACRRLPLSRKKWKGLRDMYLKERRKELEKRSGDVAGAAKKLRFSAVLSFLDPFVAPRPTTSNMGQVEEMAEDLPAPPPEEETSETEDTNGEDTEERSTPSEAPAASSVSDCSFILHLLLHNLP